MDISGTEAIGGVVGLSVIASCWSQIKMVWSKITGLIIIRAEVDQYYLAEALSMYCWTELKRTPLGNRSFRGYNVFLSRYKKKGIITVENISNDPIIFWKGWRPLMVGSATNNSKSKNDVVNISFIRGTFKLEKLLPYITEKYNEATIDNAFTEEEKVKRFYIRHIFGSVGENGNQMNRVTDNDPDVISENSNIERDIRIGSSKLLGYNIDDIGYKSKTKDPYITYLAFPENVNNMIEEIVHWKSSEEWYMERAIPWKRGWLLHGVPGTGKTSITRAIAEHLDLPLYVFDLATMTNKDLIQSWSSMIRSTPCIALFEDLDNVFEGRNNKHKTLHSNALSYDCLLNVMDGVEKSDGVFTVVTTNRIDQLDPAIGLPRTDGKVGDISTRPGRIDKVMELGLIDETCRMKIAKRILSDWVDYQDEIVKDGDGDTPAQFQERCTQQALKLFWNNKESVGRCCDITEGINPTVKGDVVK